MWIKLHDELFPLTFPVSPTYSLLTCKSASGLRLKVVSWTFCCYRLLSVSRFTLCCLAVFFNVLGVNTWFLCYSCLILTIDSTLGVQELGNGNSLLFSCIPFCLWDKGNLVCTFLFCFFYGFSVILCSIISLLPPSSPPWETRLFFFDQSFMLNSLYSPRLQKCTILNPWAWLKSLTSKVW